MSDNCTPRTDDAVMFAVSQGMRLAPLADFCRELERENAALREKFMFAESEIILLREDREELRELAARMAKEMRETDHEFCSLVDYDNLQNKI